MKALLRHPGRYLLAHWTITGALAAALLIPHHPITTQTAQGRTITLITGQVVHLNADGTPQPSPDLREGHLFGPDEYAVPNDVYGITSDTYSELGPWAQGPLDTGSGARYGTFSPQLFDVSYLEANGYDDVSTDRIPVLARFASSVYAQRAVAHGTVDGIHFTHAFEYVPYAMGYVSKHGPFVSAPTDEDWISYISLDARVQAIPEAAPSGGADDASAQSIGPSLAEAIPLIGADVAHRRGLTGKGIKIAIVDTGIDGTHGDLAGRIVAARDFSSDGNTHDNMGHGTHVAGIAAGTGALSDGKYGGVAPQASLINAKALSKNGSGTLSGIMRAMEWAADQGANIENLSLGGSASDGKDPLSQDVNAISARKNVLFVIAAGNAGPRGKVSTPAAADAALAVAAIDKERKLADFSSRGPRTGDMAVKPEIAAPGVRITAPRANHGDDDPYATYSGTSMATPMVSGAAALVMQLHPNWPAAQVKDALMNGANPIGNDQANYVSVYEQGAGMVDLRNMVDQQVLIQPANLSFGVLKSKDQRTIEVAIRNLTAQALSVDLGGALHRLDGSGTATLEVSAPRVQLPASGTATVKVTVKGNSAKGLFSGAVLAAHDGKTLARAAVGVTLR